MIIYGKRKGKSSTYSTTNHKIKGINDIEKIQVFGKDFENVFKPFSSRSTEEDENDFLSSEKLLKLSQKFEKNIDEVTF